MFLGVNRLFSNLSKIAGSGFRVPYVVEDMKIAVEGKSNTSNKGDRIAMISLLY